MTPYYRIVTRFFSLRTLKTYTFSNSLTGEHQGPKPEAGATPPPLPPPEESERPPLPPAPAPRAASATAPTPPPDTDQCPAPEPAPPTLQLVAGYGDMEIEEEQEELPADSMTDEMASFYSSLEPEEEQIEETAEDPDYASTQAPAWAGKEVLRPSPASDPSTATMSPTSSTPSSPLPVEPKSKKRKKVWCQPSVLILTLFFLFSGEGVQQHCLKKERGRRNVAEMEFDK